MVFLEILYQSFHNFLNITHYSLSLYNTAGKCRTFPGDGHYLPRYSNEAETASPNPEKVC